MNDTLFTRLEAILGLKRVKPGGGRRARPCHERTSDAVFDASSGGIIDCGGTCEGTKEAVPGLPGTTLAGER